MESIEAGCLAPARYARDFAAAQGRPNWGFTPADPVEDEFAWGNTCIELAQIILGNESVDSVVSGNCNIGNALQYSCHTPDLLNGLQLMYVPN